ncbi:hypothetical protein PV797_10565 [Clostridiaceae bacterium M8S5]|nr:hypothetical protein PV797_10565 [Clostridiaceae bacterium M8S5]
MKPKGLFYLGLYGGENSEGIWEEDFYEPKRFFSFYEDNDIKKLIERYFQIECFESFAVEKNGDFNSNQYWPEKYKWSGGWRLCFKFKEGV